MNKEEELTDILRKVEWGQMDSTVAFDRILRLFNVINSIKIALFKQLEEFSGHLPAEVYTKKVIEIKSNFNDC